MIVNDNIDNNNNGMIVFIMPNIKHTMYNSNRDNATTTTNNDNTNNGYKSNRFNDTDDKVWRGRPWAAPSSTSRLIEFLHDCSMCLSNV